MTDLNHAVFIGRIVADMKIAYVGQTAKGDFTIAVNRSRKDGDNWIDDTSFLSCVIWGDAAEGKKDKLLKGKQVAIESHVHQDKWEKDGQKQSKIVFVVDKIQILGSSSKGNNSGSDGNFKEDIPF